MEIEKLKSLLSKFESSYSSDWEHIRNFAEGISNKKIQVLEFNKTLFAGYNSDLGDINTWSTYNRCYNIDFKVENNQFIAKVIIYNGDNFYGHKTTKRFDVTLLLEDSYIVNIEKDILYELGKEAENQYEKFLREQKQSFINDFKEKMLKEL